MEGPKTGRPLQAARLRRVAMAGDRVAGDGGIGGDEPVHAMRHRERRDGGDLRVVEIRGDFDQQGFHRAVARSERVAPRHHRREQLVQALGGLQLAQVLRVGRRDVDGHVVARG